MEETIEQKVKCIWRQSIEDPNATSFKSNYHTRCRTCEGYDVECLHYEKNNEKQN